jgi:hypothetical protein
VDIAVALWIAVPLAAIHLLARRRRAVLVFQLMIDAMLLVLPVRVLLSGAHLGPGFAGGEIWGAPVTVAGSPEQSDLPLQFAVWWEEARRLAAAGEPPWVSDRIGGGAPLFAHGQTGLPFPLQGPVWVLGAERGTDVMAVWKLELAALGAFLLLRRLRLWPAAAATGALAYAFGLYALSWVVVPLAWVVAATPWTWWAMIGCLRGRKVEAAILALLLGSLTGWSVHPESAAFLWMSIAVSGAVLAWGRRRRLLRLALPLGLALAISAIGALPTLAAVADSARLAATRAVTAYPTAGVDDGMRWRALALLLTPWREGHPADGTWRLPFPSAAIEVGIGAAALTLILAGRPRRRLSRHRLALVASGCGAAVLVWQVPALAHVLSRAPVLGAMTWSRAGFLVGFALALSAAIALDGHIRRPRRVRAGLAALAVQSAVVALLLTAKTTSGGSRAWGLAASPAAIGGACLAGGSIGGWAAAGVVALEAGASGLGLLPASRPVDRPAALAAELRRRLDDEGGRLLAVGSSLPANLAARWGADDLRAHDPVRPASLARLHRALGCSGMDLPGPLTAPWSGLTGAWGVRWLVTPVAGLQGPPAAGWDEVYRDGEGRIYRNSRTLPVVRLAGRAIRPPADPGSGGWESVDFASTVVTGDSIRVSSDGELELLEQRPSRVRATIETDGESMLVVHSPRAPGWRARLDGAPSPIVDANLGAMGVAIPPGRHQVILEYTPRGLWLGALVTLIGVGGAVWTAARRGR